MNLGKMGLDLGWWLQVDDRLRSSPQNANAWKEKGEVPLLVVFSKPAFKRKILFKSWLFPRYFNSKMAKLRAFLQRLCASLVHWLTFRNYNLGLIFWHRVLSSYRCQVSKLNEDVEGPVARWRRSTSTISLELVATSELLPFLTTLDDGLAR
jgi:hypothetical protein